MVDSEIVLLLSLFDSEIVVRLDPFILGLTSRLDRVLGLGGEKLVLCVSRIFRTNLETGCYVRNYFINSTFIFG